MGKNYSLAQVAEIISTGENEQIVEVVKKYPITSLRLAELINNKAVISLLSALPESVTVAKVEKAFKDGVSKGKNEEEEEADDEVQEEAVEEAGGLDYSSMTASKLYDLCVKRGLKPKKHGSSKAYLVGLLKEADGVEEPEEEEEEETVDYDSMTAPELYKLCKKRGINAEPRQKAEKYAKLLKEADEAEEETEDDWGEEPEEKEKKGKKGKQQEVDDDDWDI